MSTERADYLDTQTLGGGEGYFHTENAETHATDGNAKGSSPETPLVAASRAAAPQQQAHTHATTTTAQPEGFGPDTPLSPGDDYETLTNGELAKRLKANGLPVPKRANKAQLVAALRGE